ncbi:MAG: MBL fold metallo-hydrolase [Gammaproteobacteria bacterium]|nr:MBL fold metallo-hydrolase [Gammaproteobacteria bacterium]
MTTVPADTRIEMIGHASLRALAGGKALLTDPWYRDPISCNTVFHFPPLRHEVEELAAETDVIYISHIHPDHFDPATLASFPRQIPVVIGKFGAKLFRNAIQALGFTVLEVPFQTPFQVPGTPFEIAILESDYGAAAAFDSSIVVRTPDYTLFNNNDCFLKPDKYAWVAKNYDVDFAFLGFSPASYFPVCFQMPEAEREELLHQASERKYRDFTDAAAALGPRLAVPFAMGIRFLHPDMLRMNRMFNRPEEAVARLSEGSGAVLGPGDRISADGGVQRISTRYASRTEEDAAVATLSDQKSEWIRALWQAEPRGGGELAPSFHDHVRELLKRRPALAGALRDHVIAFEIENDNNEYFYLDFGREAADILQTGKPRDFDMRFRYPAALLKQGLEGTTDWDELHFSCRVLIEQRRFCEPWMALLRSEFHAE